MHNLPAADRRKVLHLLEQGRVELVKREWAQGMAYMGKDGLAIDVNTHDPAEIADRVCACCAMGALYLAAPKVGISMRGKHCRSGEWGREDSVVRAARRMLDNSMEADSVEEFNDNEADSKADILALYDRAIVRAQAALEPEETSLTVT